MELFYAPGACSLSPHIVLREAGLPFKLCKVDLGSKTIEGGGSYLEVNPKGYVAALRTNQGRVLTEGPAIVQYLADQNQDAQLAPKAGTWERYQLQEWLNFITSELHKTFSPLFNKSASQDWKDAATANLKKRFDWLTTQLKDKSYLTGEHFTVADAYLFTMLHWTGFVGIDLGAWPVLKEYYARVAARPKVQEALRAEGLLK
ncbi:MAG: glutathione transferase GstA [Steroidobacteraceae bacterium]